MIAARLEAEALKERRRELSDQVFVPRRAAPSMQFVGGKKVHVAADAFTTERRVSLGSAVRSRNYECYQQHCCKAKTEHGERSILNAQMLSQCFAPRRAGAVDNRAALNGESMPAGHAQYRGESCG